MKYVLKTVIFLLVGVLAAAALLCAVFALPTQPMFENAKESVDTFKNSDLYPYLIPGYDGSKLDNYTDALMINNAVFDSDNTLIENAMTVYRAEDNEDPAQSLASYLEMGTYEKTNTYARYWHGYLVTLKPMLMLFNYSQIRIINFALFALLGLFVFMFIWKKTSFKYALGFLFAILFTFPVAIPFSLQFSTVMYITLIALAVMLLFHDKLKVNNRYLYFFLVVGMATSYMDYLTYPLAALGIPAAVAIILFEEETFKEKIIKIILYSVMFGIGYIGMWGAKWVLASLLTSNNVIADAFLNIAGRTSSEAGNYGTVTVFDVFARNMGMTVVSPLMILSAAVLVLEAVLIFIKHIPVKTAVLKALPFLLIACMPFVWMAVVSNHSYIHAWFTYRILWITAFACITALSVSFSFNKKEKRFIDKIIK